MDLEALSKRFFVRALETEDVDIIYDLCSKNKLFYEFHQPFVTRESILDDRNALPPGKSKEDKAYIGLFDGDTLVAVMDLILISDGRDRMDRIFYDGYGISEPGNRDTDHSGSSGSNEKRRLSGNPPGRRLWESTKLRVLEQK